MNLTLAEQIASSIQAWHNCHESGNLEWLHRHEDEADTLASSLLPSGSGFDNGTSIDWDNSTGEKLVFNTAFHHMNDGGMYDGWTEHAVTVRPSFFGLNITVSGRNRNDIKDYIAEGFDVALTEMRDHVEWHNLAA